MVLYLAGNFPLLNDINKEREFMRSIHNRGKPYHRLVSYFYPRTCQTVLQLKREENNGKTARPNRSRLLKGKV